MRAVLDTVTVVRSFINPSGPSGRLAARADDFTTIFSADTGRELINVVQRPGLQSRLQRYPSLPALSRVMQLIASAEIVDAPLLSGICRDPNDDKLFAAAIAGNADYIVSEDHDVLAVAEYEGVRTVTVQQFLAILDEPTEP